MNIFITALVDVPQDDSSGCNDDALLSAVAQNVGNFLVKNGATIHLLSASGTNGREGKFLAGRFVQGAFVLTTEEK